MQGISSPSEKTIVAPIWWKSRTSRISFSVLASLLVAGTLVWWFHFRPYVSTDDARIAATLIRVATDGQGGRVLSVHVTEGSRVKKGDLLVELEHGIAEAKLEKAKAREYLTSRELQRIQSGARQRLIPLSELDRARSDEQTAQADLKLATIALEETYLLSPVNGVVVQKLTDPGNILEHGQTAITVADMENSWVSANIEETSVGELHRGQGVQIHVDEGYDLTGKLLEVRRAAASQFAIIPTESASGNFTKTVQRIPVKIALNPHPGIPLRAGESVEIRIRTH